jgi:hypothetical protein
MLEPTAEIRHQIAIERMAALRRSARVPMRRKIVLAAVLAGALDRRGRRTGPSAREPRKLRGVWPNGVR